MIHSFFVYVKRGRRFELDATAPDYKSALVSAKDHLALYAVEIRSRGQVLYRWSGGKPKPSKTS